MQALRPKHQVLVLRCYPKLTTATAAAAARAKSSELAYLLYYASTRRSKLAKVCAFLAQRAASEVARKRTGSVAVTLQIAHAVVEQCPRDLPLYAAGVLRVLQAAVSSDDVAVIEASVPVFAALCRHQEPAALAADAEYRALYDDAVQAYALAAARPAMPASPAWPVAVRFRKAGLAALHAVAASPALAAAPTRQLAAVVTAILYNLDAADAVDLQRLQATEAAVRPDDGDAVAAAGTTADADRRAQDEVGVLALQALRPLVQGGHRSLLRLATAALLDTVTVSPIRSADWTTALMAAVCAWAPVQDRYVIIVGLVDALVHSSVIGADLARPLALAAVLDQLLASPVSFIGLSVMDVLVSLVTQILRLLQPLPGDDHNDNGAEARRQLLRLLQNCMAGLATHVYYTNHVSDMVDTLLRRLQPPRPSRAPSPSRTTLEPALPPPDRFFTSEDARIIALESVKAILVAANAPRPDGYPDPVARNKVGVDVWQGTQWLLRDSSGQVRKAYVDALVTWLEVETTRQDWELVAGPASPASPDKPPPPPGDQAILARLAVSNASPREKMRSKVKDTFMPLLHLAVYEHALHSTDASEADYLLLHLLLATLVTKLGLNAAQIGLPMVMRLQEDIAAVENTGAKVRIGSLVYGYLWALTNALALEVSPVGRALHQEIARRTKEGLWLTGIHVPPMPIEQISTPHPSAAVVTALPTPVMQNQALKPFDARQALVDEISESYISYSLASPPSSPPASPGRSRPISTSIPTIHQPTHQSTPNRHDPPSLPSKVRQDLLAEWSCDACLAANTKDSSSPSLSDSKSGTRYPATLRSNYLGVSVPNAGLDSSGTNSSAPSPRRAHSRPPSAATYGLVGSPSRSRSPGIDPGSTSSMRSTVRVDDLRRALSTSRSNAPRTSHSQRAPMQRRRKPSCEGDSSASDSMVSMHSLSDASFLTNSHDPRSSPILGGAGGETPAASLTPRPGTAVTTDPKNESSSNNATNGVPPVPPIPQSLRSSSISSPQGPVVLPPSHVVPGGVLAQSEARDFATLPKTMPNGAGVANDGVAVDKRQSVRSIGPRGRSGERRVSAGAGAGAGAGMGGESETASERVVSKPDFSGFLDSIEGGGGGDEEFLGAAKAPY